MASPNFKDATGSPILPKKPLTYKLKTKKNAENPSAPNVCITSKAGTY